MDISIDQNGNAKIINYISSPYDTPFIFVTELNSALTTTKEGFHYLARDFQGSVMAIYDVNAKVIERRLYDPWGNIVKVQDADGNVKEGENAKLIFLDRGYTGHEHFTEVGIIHMNGRIYDPILKQFLSPDNFIQDPENSQNYNRYGYAWNNPLKYTDPSGEEFIIAGSATLGAMVIGAIIGGAVYTGLALYNGYFSWGGLIKSIGVGAASGAIASGIGELTSVLKPAAETASFFTKAATFMGKMAIEGSMHAVSQGFIAGVTGGNIEQSLLSGAVSSVVGSIVNASGAEMLGSSDAAIILFGTVSGGVAAKLTGGNFWEGAAIGLFVSGLNHAAHNDNDEQDPPKKKIKEWRVVKKNRSTSLSGKGSRKIVENGSRGASTSVRRGISITGFSSEVDASGTIYNDGSADVDLIISTSKVNSTSSEAYLRYTIEGATNVSENLINSAIGIKNPRFDFEVINSASKFEKPNSTIRFKNIATPSVIKIYTSDGSANHIYKIFVR